MGTQAGRSCERVHNLQVPEFQSFAPQTFDFASFALKLSSVLHVFGEEHVAPRLKRGSQNERVIKRETMRCRKGKTSLVQPMVHRHRRAKNFGDVCQRSGYIIP
jgi:hypothetical protein